MAGKKKKQKKKISGKGQILGLVGLLTAIVFMPTTIMLMMGMIPTAVAAVIDKSGKGTKALTVGAMNLAGCTPFLIKLWTGGHTAELAVTLISDPRAMSIMYAGAGIGYLIDWAMSGIVGTIMLQRSTVRLKEIEARQAELVARWGREVTSEIMLDPYGFPIDAAERTEDIKKPSKNMKMADKKALK